MFKNILFIFVLLGLLLTISCNNKELFVITNVDNDEINISLDDTFQIEYEMTNLKEKINFECLDCSIVDINDNGVVTGLSIGSTEVYVTSKDKEIVIIVNVLEKAYNITFIGFDNKILKEEKVAENKYPTSPELPKIDGYRFIKWDKSIEKATSDKTYTAIYNKIINVNYELNGGIFENQNNVIYSFVSGASISLPVVSKPNYKFVGWTYTNDENDKDYITKIESENDLTIYAKYEEKEEVNMIYNYNGGYTEEALCANAGINQAPNFMIDNFNYNMGKYWDGKYTSDIFIGDKDHDPLATFSERIYIKYNKEYGLYEVVGHIASGGSTWLGNADYVITISNSYNSFYASVKPLCNKINVGDMVAFGGDFKKASKNKPIKVAFYPVGSECNETSYTLKHTEELIVPSRLGYKFIGWYKDDTKITSPKELLDNDIIYAHWEELNPVTDIVVNNIKEKIYTMDSFKIDAYVLPNDAYFKGISFVSSNTDVLTVLDDGTVKGINKGTATITITDYMKKKTIIKTIEVVSKNTLTIRLSDGYNGILAPNNSVTVTPTMHGEILNPSFIYESSNPNVATIDNGVITGVSEGLVDITITEINSKVSLTFGMTIRNYTNQTRVDELLNLLINTHFSTVEVGNFCLYNDGTQRYYVPSYGSVNMFTFAQYVQNKKYQEVARNNTSSHKSRNGLGGIEFVTVHDTATLTGTVDDIGSYFGSSGNDVSIHYAVGNGEIYACVPEEFIAFHAGDGTGTKFEWTKTNVKALNNEAPKYGTKTENGNRYLTINGETTNIVLPGSSPLTILGPVWKIVNGYYYIGGPLWNSTTYGYVGSRGGNNNSIGIEMCVNTSGDIYDTIQRTSQLVADILIRNDLDLTRVKMHNTWSGKNCPQVLIAGDYWDNFMKMVEIQYTVMKDYSDAKITFESLNKEYVNNDGRVIKYPELTMSVSYKITVEIGGVSKTITLSSILPGSTCFEQLNGTYPASKIWNNGKFELDL